MLDYCRALHAEENAILNLVRNGQSVSLRECTLYTTTYPCRLCAQKIANIKMKRVVYLEPYPQSEAKDLLNDADVIDEFFQGITFRAYFRIYGDQK
jgi:deoxycytidylate deaminase